MACSWAASTAAAGLVVRAAVGEGPVAQRLACGSTYSWAVESFRRRLVYFNSGFPFLKKYTKRRLNGSTAHG